MKVIDPGHSYLLANMENSQNGQATQFIKKEAAHSLDCPRFGKEELSPAAGGVIGAVCNCGKPFVTVQDGTTNEEVLRMLIDRLQYLQQKAPCKHNACAITHLEEGLHWLEARTADRVRRSVEGTPAT